MRSRFKKTVALIGLLVILLHSALGMAEFPEAESRLKATMLYKFLDYIAWPDDTFASVEAPYRVWVLGSGSMDDEIKAIASQRSADDRPIKVYEASSVSDIVNPHMVFVERAAQRHLPALASLADECSALIVTESEQGLEAGSVINLKSVGGRIEFDVSLRDAQRCNLRLSARLLGVASTVEQGAH